MTSIQHDPMLDVFIFETLQQVEGLEQVMLDAESMHAYSAEMINEIFRIMHTIKSSAAMMLFNNISKVAHSMEDLFYYIRESKTQNYNTTRLCDIVFQTLDFIKIELNKIKEDRDANGNENDVIPDIQAFLAEMKKISEIEVVKKTTSNTNKQYYISSKKPHIAEEQHAYQATIYFHEGCEMEHVRAYAILFKLKEITQDFYHVPENIVDDCCIEILLEHGFVIHFQAAESFSFFHDFFHQFSYVSEVKLKHVRAEEYQKLAKKHSKSNCNDDKLEIHKLALLQNTDICPDVTAKSSIANTQMMSIHIDKLDKLMDLVGEMVIAEAMVVQNPDLVGLNLDNFEKAALQLRKITSEIQDTAMSIRMVSLRPTFTKMNRIVRDMSKQLGKEVSLEIVGEDTEVDKNIIDHIGDPLMHLIRNAVDHGIESTEERVAKQKSSTGKITLEARNVGSEVLVIITDDGKGLIKTDIINQANKRGLITGTGEDLSEKEIFQLIFLPGFSTKETVTEFSGRGVGMDVVMKQVERVGGTIEVNSTESKGTMIVLRIPLTLAIIDGMNIRVGKSRYTIPTTSIKESFRPKQDDIIKDIDNHEMLMIRGLCYPVVRLHEFYNVNTTIKNMHEGIVVMIENEDTATCIFADELIGEQQVVVKALPNYIKQTKKIKGLSGCTLLGDGSISLILDVNEVLETSHRG